MPIGDILLALLEGGETSRRELAQRLDLLTGDGWPRRVVRRTDALRRAGLVAARAGPAGRVHLQLTEAGAARLGQWLARPAGCRPGGLRDLAERLLLGEIPTIDLAEWLQHEIGRRQRLRADVSGRADDASRLRGARFQALLGAELECLRSLSEHAS